MLTPKMQSIADGITEYMYKYYEPMDLELLFSLGLFPEDVIFQVLALSCRYAYLINSEKHPLSYYMEQEGTYSDSVRKEYERVIKYVRERDRLINDRIEQNTGHRFGSPDLRQIKKSNRFPEYTFTPFQYWETQNIHDMELVKSIIERRISSSNSVSNQRFVDMAEQYDNAVERMKENFGRDAEGTVFSSIQFFTLQTEYSFDYYYEVATKMEENRIKEFPCMGDRLTTTSASFICDSRLPELLPKLFADIDCRIKYPLILQRQKLIEHIVTQPEGGVIELTLSSMLEAHLLINALRSHMFVNGLHLPQFIAENTTIEDWASVFEVFDVFRTFVPEKKWTRSRIQSVRKIYNLLTVNYKALKNQEKRP